MDFAILILIKCSYGYFCFNYGSAIQFDKESQTLFFHFYGMVQNIEEQHIIWF